VIVAHIAGIPVEESLQPVLIAVLLSGAWISTRVRRLSPRTLLPLRILRKERTCSDGNR
jgi:hypothetical protein